MARLQDGLLGTSDTRRVAVGASDTTRPLGPLEQMFWLLDQHRSVHFAVTAEIAGKATVNGSICLTHTSRTPPQGLLEAMRSVLVDACVEPRSTSPI